MAYLSHLERYNVKGVLKVFGTEEKYDKTFISSAEAYNVRKRLQELGYVEIKLTVLN